MKAFFLLLIVLLCLFGCGGSEYQESTPGYACSNGSLVPDASFCIVNSCPPSCEDSNPCTFDFCGNYTKFSCRHEFLYGPQPGCSGSVGESEGLSYACDDGKCTVLSNETAPSLRPSFVVKMPPIPPNPNDKEAMEEFVDQVALGVIDMIVDLKNESAASNYSEASNASQSNASNASS